MARNVLREVLQEKMAQKADTVKFYRGFLGDGAGHVEVTGMPNYVYVTMSDGQVVKVYNKVAPKIINLPVTVGIDPHQKDSQLLEVLSVRNIPRPGSTENAYHVDAHHASHEWLNPDGGTDIVYIQLRQFMPLRPTIVLPFSLYIFKSILLISGICTEVGGVTISLFPYVPSTTSVSSFADIPAKYVLVSLSQTTGSLTVTSGTLKTLGTLALSDIPALPNNSVPLCAVRLYATQGYIDESRINTDLIDLRWGMFSSPNHNFLQGLQGGTSGEYYHLTLAQMTSATRYANGSQDGLLNSTDWNTFNNKATLAGHVVQLSGTPYTQRGALNFTGSGVTVTDDPTNGASIVTITAGAGGGTVIGPPSSVIGHIAVYADATGQLLADGGAPGGGGGKSASKVWLSLAFR
jgi:hypothetical protein